MSKIDKAKQNLDFAQSQLRELDTKKENLLKDHEAITSGENARLLNADEIAARTAITEQISNAEANVRLLQSELDQAVGEAAATARSIAGGYSGSGSESGDTQGDFSKDQINTIRSFSFSEMIKSRTNGKPLSGAEAELVQEGAKEARTANVTPQGDAIPSFMLKVAGKHAVHGRDLTATGGTGGDQGGVAVQTDVGYLIPVLRPRPAVVGLGATVRSGLVGNLDLPRNDARASYAWEGETDTNAEQSPTFDKVALTPTRIGGFTDVSKQLLAQQGQISEAWVRMQLEMAIQEGVDVAAINGNGSGQPTGILQTSGIGDEAGAVNGAIPDFSNIINLETDIFTANADVENMAYLTTPGIRGLLKQTEKATNTAQFIWGMGNEMNGYRAAVSNNVPSNLDKGTASGICHAIIFGNWRELILANWAGVDVVINPYTKAKEATVEVVVNSWWDVGLMHPASFSAMQDALLS